MSFLSTSTCMIQAYQHVTKHTSQDSYEAERGEGGVREGEGVGE
jgi:hypothetical protein